MHEWADGGLKGVRLVPQQMRVEEMQKVRSFASKASVP